MAYNTDGFQSLIDYRVKGNQWVATADDTIGPPHWAAGLTKGGREIERSECVAYVSG